MSHCLLRSSAFREEFNALLLTKQWHTTFFNGLLARGNQGEGFMSASMVAACSLSLLPLATGQPAISDVLQGIADARAMVDNFSVTSRFESVQRPVGASETVAIRLVARYVVQRDGRALYAQAGEIPVISQEGEISVSPRHVRAVFNGKATRTMGGNGDTWESGRLEPRLAIRWKMDPRDFLWAYNGRPINELIKDRGPVVQGQTVFDGRTVTIMETASNVGGDFEWKFRFLVDPSRSFAIVRKAQYCRLPSGGEWIEFHVIEATDYLEVTPGIFVPRAVANEFYSVEKDLTKKLHWRMNISNENWSVNAELSDDLFSLDFPSGLLVHDRIAGQTYRNARITDQKLREQVDQIDELKEKLAEMRTQEEVLRRHGDPRGAWVYWSLLGAGACVIVLTVVIVLKRYG